MTLRRLFGQKNKDNYEGISTPKTSEELMKSFMDDVQFNFKKSLEVEKINSEIVALHPSVHEFWGKV